MCEGIRKHWTEKISVDQGEILLRWMLHGERFAQKETDTITKLFLEMNVKPAMEILDLCCGYGTHAVRLAEKGFQVTGLDLSEANINYAKKFSQERKVSKFVNFLVGDAREAANLLRSQKEKFNGIIGILPAIGYYNQKTDENMLSQLYQLAKPQGVLILNVPNRDYHMERFKFWSERLPGSPVYEILHFCSFDYERSRRMDTWKIYKLDNQDLKHVSTIDIDRRLYSLHELMELYRRTGWTCVKSFGNYQLEPVSTERSTIIIIGKKNTKSTWNYP